ncbi:hypothetical protein [Patulibacter defluvii]|uniref:hypothetical protein n=1 Tax=Patulibacter defluvii TaxID=3095358 RepID=UPI002A756637|nr:hypothetical protein [Patulibacter sp. DM4]
MPFWIHTLAGIAVIALMIAACWRLAGHAGGEDVAHRLLGTVIGSWLTMQVTGLATQLPGLDHPTVVAGGTTALGSLAVLVAVRPAPRARDTLAAAPMVSAALAGVVTLAVLTTLEPMLGFDGRGYHLATVASWLPDGALAGRKPVIETFAVEAYPLGDVLTIGWLIAVTGSTAVGNLVGPVALGVLALGTWTLTRGLRGSPLAAWGATATVTMTTVAATQGGQVATDLPAAALLAAGAALAVAGARRDDPAGTALLLGACGLFAAVGIKTTAACGALLAIVLAVRSRRRAWPLGRGRRWAWGAALALSAFVGGVWMARTAVLHGHPAWPLAATSFGDPVPPLLRALTDRFVDHPLALVEHVWDRYVRLVWWIPVAALGALAIAIRRGDPLRRVVAATGVIGALAWTIAPATGLLFFYGHALPEAASQAVRYLLPCGVLLAAAVWSAASGVRRAVLAAAVAAVVVVQATLIGLSLDRWLAGFALDRTPLRQAAWAIGAAAVAGLLVGLQPRLAAVARRPVVRWVAIEAMAVAAIAATPGFWTRHAEALGSTVAQTPSQPILALGGVPAWSLGETGGPGGRLASNCDELLRRLASGQPVAILRESSQRGRCALPGPSYESDGFDVWPGRANASTR